MTKKCLVGILILAWLTMIGCQTESEQMKDLAYRTADITSRSVESQNLVNAAIAKSNKNVVHLHREIQQERSGLQRRREFLDHQFESLDQHRRDLHSQRRSELAWAESFQFLAIIIAATMPLFLCAYLIWASTHGSVEHEEVNSILIHELVSAEPRLIARPTLPAIEQIPKAEQPQPVQETETQTKNRRK